MKDDEGDHPFDKDLHEACPRAIMMTADLAKFLVL